MKLGNFKLVLLLMRKRRVSREVKKALRDMQVRPEYGISLRGLRFKQLKGAI